MVKKNIGDILVELGVINTQQLQECKKITDQTDTLIEACFIDKKMINAIDLARAYAEYASLPYIETITDKMADLPLLSKVPLTFLRDNKVIPIIIDGTPTILTANPMHFQSLDELNLILGGTAQYAVTSESTIIDGINRYYPIGGTQQMIAELEEEADINDTVAFEDIEEKDILTMATEAPIIKLVNTILSQAAKRGATDIHIEPFEKIVTVRFRIDGIMYDIMSPPKRIQGALISRIKIMSKLNIAEKRIPQDGRIAIKVADKAIDIRVSVLPVAFGERIVMRLLDKSRTFAQLKDLNFNERDYQIITKNIVRPNGIIYITGPTGSGKTTTLYSILAQLNRPEVNIITVEDPIEYQMKGIGQVQVKEKIDMTFAVALRAILRQDPDIIMIGETRDQETAQIAIQSALTGHLVLSTLHTNNAPAAITRLIDMGIEPFLIASSVVIVIAQRLVRKLCSSCKKVYTPEQVLLQRIGIPLSEINTITFYKNTGCSDCLETGYKGRIAIFEIMEMTPAITHLTIQRADTGTIRNQAMKDGMTLLIQSGIEKIKEGLTTIEEVLAVAAMEHDVVE